MAGPVAAPVRGLCVVALVLLAACSPRTEGKDQGVDIRGTAGKPDTQITVEASRERAVIRIVSPSGVGSADFEVSGAMPDELVLRLQLRGLEHVAFTYGETTIAGSVSGAPGNAVHESIRAADGEQPSGDTEIEEGSRYWMPIRVVAGSTPAATIPLDEGGYFEVRAPQDFVEGGTRAFSVEWVDFWR